MALEIDYGKIDNYKEFNALAGQLVEKVLREGFRIPNPRKPENSYTLTNIKVIEPEDSNVEFMRRKTRNESMVIRVYGDIVEVTPEGRQVEVVAKKVFLGSIPYRTPTGTYLLGNDYAITTQPRNLPAVYTTVASSGEGQSMFQLGKGRAFKVTLSEAGALRMVVDGKAIPLLPTLKILGFTDMELENLLGDRLWTKNRRWDQAKYYTAMNEAFFYNDKAFKASTEAEKDARIKDYMETKTYLDKDAMEVLIGVPTATVNKALFKNLIPKLVAIYRKEEAPDDRNDYRFVRMMTPSHLFADRLERHIGKVNNAITQRVRRGKDVDNAARNLITKPLHATVKSSDLSRLDPQYNLMGAVLTGNTITPIGEGAISSVDMAEMKARQFHPTQLGLTDMTFTPQGLAVGLSLRATPGMVVGEDGTPKVKLKNIKTKKTKPYTLHEASKLIIIQPGEPRKGNVKAFKNYKEVTVPFNKVTHEFAASLFADSMQMVPGPSAMQGPRGIMAATQFAQAVPLVHRESPRVKVKDPETGKPSDKVIGYSYLNKLGLVAPIAGTITKITPTKIVMESTGGQKRVIETEEVVPLQYNTGIKIQPKPGLKVGDKVKKGDPIFVTNMHDEGGNLAPGIHLRVGWMVDPEGYGAEDGIVISESAAKKLTSQHFYKIEVEAAPGEEINLKLLQSFFRHKYSADRLASIDPSTGMVKVGSKVKEGDVLVAKVAKRDLNEMDAILGRVSRTLASDWMDTSIVWDKFHEGRVDKIEESGRSFVIVIETEEPAEIGSKVTGRYGNKGVVTMIRPDDDMPRNEKGQALDIILSPASVPSRINPMQNMEAALGTTGKDYVLDHFDSNRDLHKFTSDELEKHKKHKSGRERLFDPITGTENDIGVGDGYFLKLFSPEKSISARGIGGAYDGNMQPIKGGKEGSKALGLMEFYALLGHNSKELLKEFGTVKSEKNINFWRNFELGLANMPKDTPYTFGKFGAILTASGAHMQRTPNGYTLLPVTDKITSKLSEGRKIKKPETVKGNSLQEIEEGLFDPKLTGGKKGKLWTEYELADGIPHPLLDNVLRIILNKKKEEWQEFMSTAEGKDLKKMLKDTDIKAVKKRIREDIDNNIDVSNNTQALRFLTNLPNFDAKLEDFIITKIPVVPPTFRPFISMPDGTKTINDLNYLYIDVMTADQLYRESEGLPETRDDAKRNLTGAVRAFVGLEEPRSNVLKEKGVRGALNYLTGVTSPKEGFFLNKMMKRQMIGTGRARLIPDPTANMDEVGIPEFTAWKSFEPHLRKELRSMGFQPSEITEMLDSKDPRARRALDKVVKENYVLVNRAPTLHRFSILAGRPKLVDGVFMSLPNAFEAPLNADYDGDEATFHVPITKKGKEEAERMLLSNNPFTGYSAYDLTTGLDSEAVTGLYMSQKRDPKEFARWWKANMPLDVPLRSPMDKSNVKGVLKDLGKNYKGEEYAKYYGKLNRKGFEFANREGLTMSLSDLRPIPEVEVLINKYTKEFEKAPDDKKGIILGNFQNDILKLLNESGNPSSIITMLKARSKGSPMQASGILATPAAWASPLTGEVSPIRGNTSRGYDFSDFYKMNAKARDEMIKTKTSVAAPGDLYKQLAFNTRKAIITEKDCGTDRGRLIKTKEADADDLLGRCTAKAYPGFPKDTIIGPDNISEFLDKESVLVRSPNTCDSETGLCAKCYGADDDGKLPPIGDHVNIRAVNSFSMAVSQKALDAKHSVRSFSGDAERKSLVDKVKGQLLGSSTIPAPPVSGTEGVVVSIEQLDNKSWVVKVDKTKYIVPYPLKPTVKVKDKVVIGQVLGEGAVNTKQVANDLGHGYARKMFTSVFKDDVLGDAGINPHTRNIELLGSELYKYVRFVKDLDEFIPGDIVTIKELKPVLEKHSVSRRVSSISPGDRLGEAVLEWLPLDVVSSTMIADFEENDIKTVKIFTRGDYVEPIAKGMSSLPLLDTRDWIDTMGFRYLKRNITQAVASGATQKINKTSPISQYVTNSWED